MKTSVVKGPHLQVELITGIDSIRPGESFTGGIHFKLEKHWHVYFKNPGDSGESPKVSWVIPPGVHAGQIQWPIPKRIETGPLVNFGYENEIIFPISISVDPSYLGAVVPLRADVTWLVCDEICIPGKGSLEVNLSVNKTVSAVDDKSSGLLHAVEEALPKPVPQDWKLQGLFKNNHFDLTLHYTSHDTPQVPLQGSIGKISHIEIFPMALDQIDNSAIIGKEISDSSVSFHLAASERLTKNPDHLPAMITLTNDQGRVSSYEADFPLHENFLALSSALAMSLFFAFLGGIILNLMPCVFPVLSMKVMGILKMSGEEKKRIRGLGLLYSLGILVSFWALVGTLLLLRTGGQQLGWGFQLQSPGFVLILASALFMLGLNLLGVFEITGSFAGAGSSLANRPGYLGSFFTGVLATLVATPCTAPFMGSAMGYALTQPGYVVFIIFSALALGLAFPYLLISYFPKIAQFLPRPGRWMETFKQLMAFLIFGSVIWLSWVLSFQVAQQGLVILLSVFLSLGFSAWIFQRWSEKKFALFLGILLSLVSISLGTIQIGGQISGQTNNQIGGTSTNKDLVWEKFTPEVLQKYRDEGKPVFVDFTAAWCVSCQVNELLVFRSEKVIQKIHELGLVLLKADWTNQDPMITRTLASFGRNGVPFYILYGKGRDLPAMPLPEVISAGMVLDRLNKMEK